MKKYLAYIIGCMLLMPAVCPGQPDKWTLSLDYGLQAHDKRLFDFPPFPAARILEQQQETFGTHQFGVSGVREMAEKGRLQLFAGGGLGVELATFSRPFDHGYGNKISTEVLLFTDRYYNYMIQLPLRGRYTVSDHLSISMDIMPQFNFFTRAGHTMSNKNYSWMRLNLYSVEFNPGIEYTCSRLVFALRYRAFQVKKIDRILFNHILRDPRTDQTFETYNPFKLWLSVGYKLGGNQ